MGNLMLSKKHILASSPHIETTTPMCIANFTTDMIAPLKSCQVEFQPIQDTSNGNPSPSNICPITGWTGFNTYHTSKNLVDINKCIPYNQNVTITISNNNITVTNTNSYAINVFNGTQVILPIGTYTVSIKEAISRPLSIYAWNGTDYSWINNGISVGNTSASFTLSEQKIVRLQCLILSDSTLTIPEVQLEIGSQKTAYEPYIGTTIPAILPIGKNLFDEQYSNISANLYYRSYYIGDGEVIASSDCPKYASGSNNYSNIFIIPGIVTTGASTGTNNIDIDRFRYITPIDGYITIVYRNTGGVDPREYHTMIERKEIGQIEPSTYESAVPIYGGSLNLITGILTVTHKMWTRNTADMNSTNENYPGWVNCGAIEVFGEGLNGWRYTNSSLGRRMNCGTIISINTTNGRNNVYLPKDAYHMTQDEWKELALDVQFINDIPEPYTVQLTSQQIKSFLNINNIWTDTNGNMIIKYWTH